MWPIVTGKRNPTMRDSSTSLGMTKEDSRDDFENVSTTYVINAAVMLSEAKHL
jgi:hypothetical protein